MSLRQWMASAALFAAILTTGAVLAGWKAASAEVPAPFEPAEAVTAAVAHEREHRRTTTAIGTVVAVRSIALRNEVAGTVKQVLLSPGLVVDEGALLVALDISVEEAELKALEARAVLAEAVLARTEQAVTTRSVSEMDLDRARAERDVAAAQVARTKAVIARKTIRAPFRARVGLSDVHPGQYLSEGTLLTTLQSVDSAVHVDFAVPQRIAEGLRAGDSVDIHLRDGSPSKAAIVAVDARVDSATRNATVRARLDGTVPAPGASVRVEIPVGAAATVVAVPVSALRRGPAGDHVFVIDAGKDGKPRAQARPVQGGAMIGDEVLVLSGLSAGETVAASGSFKLRDGALVSVVEATK